MKKILCLLMTAILCFSFTACGTQYEDTNGPDDYSLQTITDENIINLDVESSGLSYSEQSLEGATISTEYSSRNFNGVERIYNTNYILPSDVQVYIGTMSVTEGNFKLAVISNDEIIQEIPLDTFNQKFYFEDIEGEFSVHVAGECAAFEFHIDIY